MIAQRVRAIKAEDYGHLRSLIHEQNPERLAREALERCQGEIPLRPEPPVYLFVGFFGPDGMTIKGWYGEGKPGHGAVMLLHGIRGDRRKAVNRAQFLQEDGFGVLLIDLQGHGESSGKVITFGYREAQSAAVALDYLKKRNPQERIGVIGASLGGASALLGDGPLQADALILESVFATIEEAHTNRLNALGFPGRLATPIIIWQLSLRLGIRASQLRPIERVPLIKCPVLIMGGRDDKWTPMAETQRMFEAAPEPKELWLVDGARHTDLYKVAGKEYERRVLGFLNQYLRHN